MTHGHRRLRSVSAVIVFHEICAIQ